MKRIVLLFLTLALPALLFAQDSEQKKVLKKTKVFIKSKMENPSIYWGEGLAKIGSDLNEAYTIANKRALGKLVQQIQVQIKNDITTVISGTSLLTGETYTETIEDEIIDKTQVYSDLMISNVNEKRFLDYPKQGYLTYFVWILRGEYEAKVKKDLDNKKTLIRQAVQNGDMEFKNRNFMAAVNHWIHSQNYKENFFGSLPLLDDLNNDENWEDVTAYLDKNITGFFSKTTLSFLKEDVLYDVQGKVTQKPVIYAQYKIGEDDKRPITNLPLKVNFVNGEGRIAGDLSSGNYGETSLPFSWINPAYAATTIRVEIDTAKIQGLGLFTLPPLSFASLTLTKVKTIALSVSFFDGAKTVEPEATKNKLNAHLLSNGFSVVPSFIGGKVTTNALEKVRRTNADYFLFVHINTSSSGTVGGFANMYAANCNGLISLYKLPQGNLERSENITSVQGFGVSASGAAWDAYGKLKKKISQKSMSILRSIK